MRNKVIRKFRDIGILGDDKTKFKVINNDTNDVVELVSVVTHMMRTQKIKHDQERLDLLNYAKSQLEHLVRPKLDKSQINWDSVKFLTSMIRKLSDGKEGNIKITSTDGYNEKVIATTRKSLTVDDLKFETVDFDCNWDDSIPQYGDIIQITDEMLPFSSDDRFVITSRIPDSNLYCFVELEDYKSGDVIVSDGYAGETQFKIIK